MTCKPILRHGLCLLLLGALLTLSAACSMMHEDYADTEQGTVEAYVSVRIAIGSGFAGTRADDPKGGDDGNGREAGINQENTIHNVTLLLFKDLTTSAVSQIINIPAHELTLSGSIYETYPHKVTVDYGEYHVVAIANLNENIDFNEKSFPQIANIIAQKPWENIGTDIDKTDHFTMTSITDATVSITRSETLGTYENPFVVGDITVERLAARIDIDADGSKAADDFTYDYLKQSDNSIVGTVKILEVKAFNLLTSGTYLLKHFSANGTGTDIAFYGTEGTSPTQTHYVWDPHTSDKTAETYTNSLPDDASLSAQFATTPAALLADKTVASGDDANHKYFILTYAQENTLPKSMTADADLRKYATALAVHYTITENGGTPVDYYDTYLLKHNNNSDVMRYGIVRNNIYRVSFIPPKKTVEEDNPKLTLKIKVKKWDVFTHSTIYM